MWRKFHITISMRNVNLTIEEFQKFCAKHVLNFEDVLFKMLKKQLLLRVSYFRKTRKPRKPVSVLLIIL